MTEEKGKNHPTKKGWKKQCGKDLFTWVHRYLRLHNELLADDVYLNMYVYVRNELIADLKKDIDIKKQISDARLGEIIDLLADSFNKDEVKSVNKCKSLVYELHKVWEKELK